MPSFTTRRRVTFSPEQMFALVADVERYPEFLPLCEGLTLMSRHTATDPVKGETSVLVATMTAGYQAIRENFTTRVTLLPGLNKVVVEYLDGPFSRLENRWLFKPLAGGGCEVDFFIDYELKSFMLGLLVGAVFDKAFRRFAEAFETRAKQIYGRPGIAARTA
jgi:coenzyme Q-binding protein COQ10